MLSFTRQAGTVLLVALILVAGVWASWGSAQHVMLTKGRERGTMTVTRCADSTCTGSYAPLSPGSRPRARVVIDRSIAEKKGTRVPVVVKPGTREVVRAGAPGFFHAWVPLGGALLLTAVVIAGGLQRKRLAWVSAGAGGLLLTAAFVTVTF
ncbi:hypothetical protein EOT10_31890 [Streptomyces antnestii]|uniref:DUF3592 domain-containing protein n=1 Tax=Streptomyces antnestii TaxID=2494256 RepID=A0A3S2VB78_9ACTN|nr:hypothetical protein [Streptomyces sp. San01]RVU18621.1 hypothetical protein EOT10_31890 [Streptomyces sp. San01]